MHSMTRLMAGVAVTVLAGWLAPPAVQPVQAQGMRGTVTCSSNDHRLQRCRVGGDVRLVRQLSKAPCVRGRTWGVQGGVLWVSEGCRGTFARVAGQVRPGRSGAWPSRPGTPTPWRPGGTTGSTIRFSCGSADYKYRFCTVDVGARGHVQLERQESDTRCVLNRNWGWNRAGIWTDRGCRARFIVLRRG